MAVEQNVPDSTETVASHITSVAITDISVKWLLVVGQLQAAILASHEAHWVCHDVCENFRLRQPSI